MKTELLADTIHSATIHEMANGSNPTVKTTAKATGLPQ